jgi:hypothetical protein
MGVAPLFNPLRIEYEWTGCFQYDRQNPGHAWTFSEPPEWKRLTLKANIPGGLSITTPVSLKEHANRYSNAGLRSNIRRMAKSISGQGIPPTAWGLLKWLAELSTEANVGRGLSMVLNSLVRQSTTKHFDLLSSFVGAHITVEVRELGAHVPCWFYLHASPFEDLDEYLVCFPELFLRKEALGWVLTNDAKKTTGQLLHLRCKHRFEVLEMGQGDKRLKVILKDTAVITNYIKGVVCGCIPVPGKCPRDENRGEPDGVNSPEVVVSSPIVGTALASLSRIWQDPYAKTVLISSPAGSGKEVFANSIPPGNGRPQDKVVALSMASGDHRGLERQLYGFARADGSIQKGLIALASGAALFLDEVHQPEGQKASATRASLLRTLEAGKYFPLESTQEQEVANVLWVMATSKTLNELRRFKPNDFWTRMTHALRIPHPLDLPATPARNATVKRIVSDFFRLFWWDLCDKQYQLDPLTDPSRLPSRAVPAYWQQRTMLDLIVDKDGVPRSRGYAHHFSTCFLKEVRRRHSRPCNFSARGIRNMVSRLFAIGWSGVAQGQEPWADEEAFARDVSLIFRELRNVALL